MNLLDHAKNIVCSIIAVALAMSVASIEALLPRRPDWLERINELALQLKHRPESDTSPSQRSSGKSSSVTPEDPGSDSTSVPEMDAEQLLRAYNQLWQFAHAVRSNGLALDD